MTQHRKSVLSAPPFKSALGCNCKPGFTGDYCERPISCECLLNSDCDAFPDKESRCVYVADNPCGQCHYKCDNFWMRDCLKPPVHFTCDGYSCSNFGKCEIDENGLPFCKCTENYIGELCERASNPCSDHFTSPIHCANGGRCRLYKNTIMRGYCECPIGFSPPTCEKTVDYCKGNPCEHGTCQLLFNGFSCQCHPGYFGPRCDYAIDPCSRTERCGNGRCIALTMGYDGEFRCDCDPGWDPAEFCRSRIDPCRDNRNRCADGSTCRATDDGYVCMCPEGRTGRHCDEPVKYCAAEICLNGATCREGRDDNGVAIFKCDCVEGTHGPNCEESRDPCLNIQCQHSGKCVILAEDQWKCECVGGYNGKLCEIPPSKCEEDPKYCNSGTCERSEDGYDYCNCPVEYTGVRCETAKPDNYNFLFTGIPTASTRRQRIQSKPLQSYVFKRAMTLMGWARYGLDGPRGDHSMNGTATALSAAAEEAEAPFAMIEHGTGDAWNPVLWLSDLGVSTSSQRLIIQLIGRLEWHMFAVECNFADNKVSLRIDGKLSASVTLPAYLADSGDFRITVGETASGRQIFVGEVSLIQLYDRIFTEAEFTEMLNNCPAFARDRQSDGLVIPWHSYTTVDSENSAVLSIYPGICVTSPCLPGRADCSAERDKIPPRVINCPHNIHVISSDRLTRVEWPDNPDEMFEDNDMLVSVSSNFRSGQSFTWGVYHIVYVAKDRAENSATCEFDVVVAPQRCAEPEVAENVNVNITATSGEEWKVRALGTVRCVDSTFVFTQKTPMFYTCDQMGRWNRFVPIGTTFTMPSCSSTVNPLQNVNGTHSLTSCTEAAEYRRRLRRSIIDAHRIFDGGFCQDPECEGQLEVWDDCKTVEEDLMSNSTEARRRREIHTHWATVSVWYSLNVSTTPYAVETAINTTMNSTFSDAEKPNIATSFECITAEYPQFHWEENPTDPTKDMHQCASCPPGEFFEPNSKTCNLCPVDTYKSEEGTGLCHECADNRITGNKTGCTKTKDCFLNCPAGSYFLDSADSCALCPRGQYMPYAGRLKCSPCPIHSTTPGPGAKSQKECSEHCLAGTEMSDGENCRPCDRGSYRTNEMDACKRCDRGLWTRSPGAKSEADCSLVICPPGHYGNAEQEPVAQPTPFEKICNQCAVGFYQDEEGKLSCKRCPDQKSTPMKGATTADHCSLDSGLTCTPSKADQCPEGTECVLLDTGIYECRELAVTHSPIRHPLPAWAWIIIVGAVMLVSLIAGFFLLMHRERLLRWFDERHPGLLRCWALKEGGRRFSLNPTRDVSNLPFTPEENGGAAVAVASTMGSDTEAPTDDQWSSTTSRRSSGNRWAETRFQRRRSTDRVSSVHPDDPEEDPISEIRSGLIEVMDGNTPPTAKAANGRNGTGPYESPPPPPPNHGLRVETKPTTFFGLSKHRRSMSRHQHDGIDSTETRTETHAAATDGFSTARFNRSGYAWSSRDVHSPQSVRAASTHQRQPSQMQPMNATETKPSARFDDDDNVSSNSKISYFRTFSAETGKQNNTQLLKAQSYHVDGEQSKKYKY